MKYMLILVGPEGGMEDASPEEMKAEMGRWAAFGAETVEKGAFVSGEGLEPSSTATTVRIPADGGDRVVTDGPFAETKEQLGGFYVLECKDLDEALDWARKVPLGEGSVEVRPVMDYEAAGYEPQSAEAGAS